MQRGRSIEAKGVDNVMTGNREVKLRFSDLSCRFIEAIAQRCSAKMVFLEISENSKENTYTRVSFLITLQASGLQLY